MDRIPFLSFKLIVVDLYVLNFRSEYIEKITSKLLNHYSRQGLLIHLNLNL
jgi:hypothetical protein